MFYSLHFILQSLRQFFKIWINSEYHMEYVDWMNKQGKKPIGSYLQIGNFKGYKDSVGDL